MKEASVNNIHSGDTDFSAVTLPGFTPKDDREAIHLEGVLSELAELREALGRSQRETHAARNIIRKLEELNSHLSRELARLEQNEANALALACYDELTGLPNRRLLRDRLRQAIAQGIRLDKQVALLLVDLDGFKSINDRLGHPAGDRLLQAVAKRLTESIRAADTACRYGGDEFVIMLPAVDQPTLASAVAEKVRSRLAEPYIIDGFEIRMTGSIGVVFCPEDGRGYEELLKKADRALYRAKAKSRSASITVLPRETDTSEGATPGRSTAADELRALVVDSSATSRVAS
jgi:diguanylate cyclase (GGDEF)-like protein